MNMTAETKQLKIAKIKGTNKDRKIRRVSQHLKIAVLKIENEKEVIKNANELFRLANYFKNYILANNFIFDKNFNTKIKEVPVTWVDDDGVIQQEIRDISKLPSQIKQSIITELQANVKTLKTQKKNGRKIGKIKFFKQTDSLTLKQYKKSHKIINRNTIRIVGLGHVKVHGLDQINLKAAEFANARLIRKPSGLYVHLTYFLDKQISNIRTKGKTHKIKNSPTIDAVGIDMGIKNSITTSDGFIANICIKEPDRLKKLQREYARVLRLNGKNKRSNKAMWLKDQIRKEYEHVTNQKRDIANKIVGKLTATYKNIAIQNENLKGWQKGWFGRQVQRSCLGTLKAKIIASGAKVVDKWEATTQECYVCHTKTPIGLDERIFVCANCNHTEERDVKSSKTVMQKAGFGVPEGIIMEVKPFDYHSSFYTCLTGVVNNLKNQTGLDESGTDEGKTAGLENFHSYDYFLGQVFSDDSEKPIVGSFGV